MFVHADSCGGYDPELGVPAFLGAAPRMLRAYTDDQAMQYRAHRITEAGEDLTAVLVELFLQHPDVAEVHVRNLEAQCFIARATPGPSHFVDISSNV